MANTFSAVGPKAAAGTRGDGVSEREDLANFISMISRDETPFLSSIGKTKATAILHEWQTDELALPGSNAVVDGVSFATASAAQAAEPYRTRIANMSQINSKTATVTGTKRAIDQAGVADEYAYQIKKRGIELKRDIEWDLVHSGNSYVTAGTRKMAGYQGFINHWYDTTAGSTTTNGIAGSVPSPTLIVDGNGNAAAAAFNSTTGTLYRVPTVSGIGTAGAQVTGATLTPLTLIAVDNLMQNIYQNGGKASRVMLSPANRKAFSAKVQAVSNTRRTIDDGGKLRQSIEIYMSDFGDIQVVPNYIMGMTDGKAGTLSARDYYGLVYDPMWFARAVLRPLQEVELGQTGDSIIGQILEEGSFEVKNPKGSGLIVGLNGQ